MDILNKERSGTVVPSKGKVVIATNIVRTKERLDKDGNIVDPKTKQIIKKADEQ